MRTLCVFLALLTSIAGCISGGDDTDLEPDSAASAAELEMANGGFTLANEAAEFGDDPLLQDAGNQIVAAAIHNDDACDVGTMRGRWRNVAPNLGHFVGMVADQGGQKVGHVRGIFGERRNGDRVVLGKFINRDGVFRGILSGTYDLDGHFRARWLARRAGDQLTNDGGRLRGVYVQGLDKDPRDGVFLARWAETACGDDI